MPWTEPIEQEIMHDADGEIHAVALPAPPSGATRGRIDIRMRRATFKWMADSMALAWANVLGSGSCAFAMVGNDNRVWSTPVSFRLSDWARPGHEPEHTQTYSSSGYREGFKFAVGERIGFSATGTYALDWASDDSGTLWRTELRGGLTIAVSYEVP